MSSQYKKNVILKKKSGPRRKKVTKAKNSAVDSLAMANLNSGTRFSGYDLLRQAIPYYNVVDEALKTKTGNKIVNGIRQSLGKPGGKFADVINSVFPSANVNRSELALRKEVAKMETKEKKLEERSIIQGPTKSISYQKTPSLRRVKGGGVLDGGELYKVITAPAEGYASGAVITDFDLNFTTMSLPVLRGHIKNYEEFRVRRLTFTLVGGSGNNATGTFVMVYDPDPLDVWNSGADLAKRATNAKYKTLGRPFDICHLDCPKNEKGELYIDNESGQERFESFGHFAMVCLNPIAANTPIGALYISYDIQLYNTQSDPDLLGGDFLAMNCDSGTGSAFSTSCMAAEGITSSYSTVSFAAMTPDDWKQGIFRLPAGSYRACFHIAGGVDAAYSSSFWSVNQTGKYAPWMDTTYGSATLQAGVSMTQDRWVGCLSSFAIKLNMTAGTWTKVYIWISATTASPYASNMKGLSRLQNLVDSASKESAVLEQLKRDEESKEPLRSDKDVKTTKNNEKFGDFVVVPQQFSSSSSSSSSSGRMNSYFGRSG